MSIKAGMKGVPILKVIDNKARVLTKQFTFTGSFAPIY